MPPAPKLPPVEFIEAAVRRLAKDDPAALKRLFLEVDELVVASKRWRRTAYRFSRAGCRWCWFEKRARVVARVRRLRLVEVN